MQKVFTFIKTYTDIKAIQANSIDLVEFSMMEENAELFTSYIESGKNSLKIVISGKMGVGKSSLINGLVGKEVSKEAKSVLAVTNEIKSYSFTMKVKNTTVQKTIDVTVLDTPGLADPFRDEEANLKAIAEHCSDCDLLIYCMDMRVRLTEDDDMGIKKLTDLVGPQVWKNTVFALTFANGVKHPPRSSFRSNFWYYASFGYYNAERDGRLELFQRLQSEWVKRIHQTLKQQNLPDTITDDLSIVPTGYRVDNPPDCKDWLTPFWCEAFRKTNESSQPTFLGINFHRMHSQPLQESGDSDAAKLVESSTVRAVENHQQMVQVDLDKVAAVVKGSPTRKIVGLTGLLTAAIGTPHGMVEGIDVEEEIINIGFGLTPIIEAIQKYESTKSLKT